MTHGPRFLAACLSACLLLTAAAAKAQQRVSVDRPTVNLRAGPGTQHDIVWELGRGYPLEVIGRRGDWLHVKDFENDRGWIHRPLTGRTPHHVVQARVANIRSGPSTATRVVGRAERGEVLRTLEKRPAWVKVKQEDGASGWVSRPLLWGW